MTTPSKTEQNSPTELLAKSADERFLEDRRSEDLAKILSNLENNNFIPVEALTSVAEILTYLYDKESATTPAESET